MEASYPLFKAHVNVPHAVRCIESALSSGYLNEGTFVDTLAHWLSNYMLAPHLTLVNSCTSALTLALRLANVQPGDDVVTTSMTCLATNAPIATLGANIVWADVDPAHGMLTADTVAAAITPRTRAVIVVAWAGNPPDMLGIKRVCAAAGVPLILDAAHAFDAMYRERPIHEYADYTCYSFQAIKHFTTGDGGALVCSAEDAHRRARALKWFGIDRLIAKDHAGEWRGQQWDVDVLEAGYKFNMNNVAAAIGCSQFDRIDNVLGAHRCNASVYDSIFRAFRLARPLDQPSEDEGGVSSHWVYTMRLDPERCTLDRDSLLASLNAEGIKAGVVHVPNHRYSCFKQSHRDLPGVDEFARTQFSLPCGWWLSERDIWHIAERTMKLLR